MLDVIEEVPVLDALPLRQERRRAGRVANVSPALIPLLRDEGQPTCDDEELRGHDLAPATGILMSVLLSSPIWVAIGRIIYFH